MLNLAFTIFTFSQLVAFGMFDGTWSPYASMINLELWQASSGNWMVRFNYNGKSIKPSKCKGNNWCTYQEFTRIVQEIILNASVLCNRAVLSK
jgi:hypothetical protein